MDTITASLLTALVAAAKDKAAGAFGKYLQEAVEERAKRLWGVLAESDEQKFAKMMVENVVAEAADFPPDKALLVEPLGTVGTAGIWGPKGTLKVNLLWVNRADFPIHIRDLKLTCRADTREPEWSVQVGDEFTLGPRRDVQRVVETELQPAATLPTFTRNGAPCDISVTALVCGPWDEGRAQRTQDLVQMSVWMPVIGLEPSGLLVEDRDIEITLAEYLQSLVDQGEQRVRIAYVELDRTLNFRAGATKSMLQRVAGQKRHEVEAGPSVAIVKLHHPVQYLHGGYGGTVEDPDF
ncbi:MAG: hypothetical protein KF773_32435 [Deltaproteobacteria bacterium]|nr:hypothetical protein [Deltaproteobacteria bacterium]